jgi:formate dehydrogenase assembly factor FdhD
MTVPVSNVKVAPSEVLEIRASGEVVDVLRRTPGADRELAIGLLFARRLIQSARDVAAITHCGRVGDPRRANTIDVRAAPGFAFDYESAWPSEVMQYGRDECELATATLFDEHGEVVASRYDLYPLNAIDKAIGAWLLAVELHASKAKPYRLVINDRVSIVMRRRTRLIGIADEQVAGELDRQR